MLMGGQRNVDGAMDITAQILMRTLQMRTKILQMMIKKARQTKQAARQQTKPHSLSAADASSAVAVK